MGDEKVIENNNPIRDLTLILRFLHADWSRVCRLRMQLEHSAPHPKEGMEPEIKTDFPVSFKMLKMSFISFLVHSDS